MKKQNPVIATAAVLAASLSLAPTAGAADNPFALRPLDGGYQLAQADKAKDAKCGADKAKDAKCGADKAKDAKCGADKAKDGSCGADKKKSADKKKDGKCPPGGQYHIMSSAARAVVAEFP